MLQLGLFEFFDLLDFIVDLAVDVFDRDAQLLDLFVSRASKVLADEQPIVFVDLALESEALFELVVNAAASAGGTR